MYRYQLDGEFNVVESINSIKSTYVQISPISRELKVGYKLRKTQHCIPEILQKKLIQENRHDTSRLHRVDITEIIKLICDRATLRDFYCLRKKLFGVQGFENGQQLTAH